MNPYGYAPTYQPGQAAPMSGVPGSQPQPGAAYGPDSYIPGAGVKPVGSDFSRGEDDPRNFVPNQQYKEFVDAKRLNNVLPGLPQAGGFLSDPYAFKMSFGQGEFDKWKTAQPYLSGQWTKDHKLGDFSDPNKGVGNQYTGQSYQNPFEFFNKTPFWGSAGLDGKNGQIFSALGLMNRIQNMSAMDLNNMDFDATRKAFEGVAQNLHGAYANKDYQYMMGSSLDEQKNWLQNAYNLLVQRGQSENIF
jgi:hypothetical protein